MSSHTICLVGNPNSGKTTIFNQLSGESRQVGNHPGVTVTKQTGTVILSGDNEVNLIDLPGLYSLYPNSTDERLVVNILTDPSHQNYPDLIVYVANVKHIDKHLLLATQLIDLQIPMVFVANMADMVAGDQYESATNKIQKQLGVPVINMAARKGVKLDDLKSILDQWIIDSTSVTPGKSIYQLSNQDNGVIDAVMTQLPEATPYQAKVVAHHSEWLSWLTDSQRNGIANQLNQHNFNNTGGQIEETLARYRTIDTLAADVKSSQNGNSGDSTSEKIDRVLAHRIIGPLIFFAIMFFVFQAIFTWAAWPMDMIEESMAWLGSRARNVLPAGWIADLVSDGILAGLGGIFVFIPQIFILFLLIGLLEEVGYMSRVVFIFDGLHQHVGLSGRSIVALISSSACAIPAIMSTRTISNWKERLITIMVSPLISCSARIPVYAVLVGFVVPTGTFGPFNIQGLAFMGLYLLGVIGALGSAYVFKKIIKSNHQSYLMMELPTYQPPRWIAVFKNALSKVWSFIVEAGKIIFVISIIIWLLSSFGPSNAMADAERFTQTEQQSGRLSAEDYDNALAANQLEASYIGHLGKFVEPVFRPLGFDWKMSIAVLTSFAAREVFVGTMATIYSLGSTEDELTVREKMATEINPATGGKRYDIGTALSLLLFYVFAMQCMSTLAVTKQETGSWKWPIIQFVFMTALAYLAAMIAFQVLA